jgi:HSP20 family molecular chaperone IbpA
MISDAVHRLAAPGWVPMVGPHSAARSYGEVRLSRLALFNSPLLLGFDRFEATLERIAKTSTDGYPPYNVEQTGPDRLRITLAVAGFAESDLTVQMEGRQLVIRGKQADETDRVFLHRGIAARQFQRSYVLADGIDVVGATLEAGLLHIDLVQPLEESRVKTIEVRTVADNKGSVSGLPASAKK